MVWLYNIYIYTYIYIRYYILLWHIQNNKTVAFVHCSTTNPASWHSSKGLVGRYSLAPGYMVGWKTQFDSVFLEKLHAYLVGGFNPSEKYWSKWEYSPNRGENQKWLNQQPPPRYSPCLNSSFLNCKVLMMFFSMAIGLISFYFFGSLPYSKTKTPTDLK